MGCPRSDGKVYHREMALVRYERRKRAMSVKRGVVGVTPDRSTEVLKPGYIRDYVSDVDVKASPEEIEAVQVFAKRLVEDYGYPKNCLQTRPQFRVRKRPSDEA